MCSNSLASLLLTATKLWLLCPIQIAEASKQTPLQLPQSISQTRSSNRLGAVASENRICSQIGIDLLAAGGNAADALVGTVICVGVVDCHHSGLGGGGFALARAANGSYETIDFRETAPAAAHENMFEGNVLGSLFGGLASGVPGELRGLDYISKRYGKLPWLTLLRPAISLARDGFVVSEDFVKAMDLYEEFTGSNVFVDDPVWAIDFAPNGTRVGAGDVMTRMRYARTLEAVALFGADMLYEGPLAEAIIITSRGNNGTMTMKDLEDYTVVPRRPVEIDYMGYHVYACGAPASGSVTLSALKIMEKYEDCGDNSDDLYIHRMVEAMRFGYGKRASFGDPDYVDGLREFEEDMLGESFAETTRGKISDEHTLNVSAYDPEGFEIQSDHGTSHVVTADASGMAFSLTTTINLFFGSRLMDPETGIILNDEMNDFSIPNISNAFGYYPSPANYAKPHKRPLSSIAPIMVEYPNGTLCAIFGASGGSKIITATLQNALHILDANMSVRDALASPRLHDQLIPNQALFEETYDNTTVAFMRERGHNTTWTSSAGSSAQAIKIVNGRFEAGGEPRQKNSAGLTI